MKPYPEMKKRVEKLRKRIGKACADGTAQESLSTLLREADRALECLVKYVDYNWPKYQIGKSRIKAQFAFATKGLVRGLFEAAPLLISAHRVEKQFVDRALVRQRATETTRSFVETQRRQAENLA